jgi:hypothetical protein
MAKIYLGDVVTFDLDTEVTITGRDATVYINYKKPSGTTGQWSGTVEGTTEIRYTTVVDTDLDEPGVWEFQAYDSDWDVHGDTVIKRVHSLFQ